MKAIIKSKKNEEKSVEELYSDWQKAERKYSKICGTYQSTIKHKRTGYVLLPHPKILEASLAVSQAELAYREAKRSLESNVVRSLDNKEQ